MSELQVSKWHSRVFSWSFLRISRSFMFSQNFVKNWKFSWPRSLAKFQILTTFWTFSYLTYEWIASLKMAFQSVLLIIFKDFWKFYVESKFCQKLKIFMTAVLSEISDFDHFWTFSLFDLWVNYKSQNGIQECSLDHLKDFWKFEVESKFCQKLKIFMTAVLSEISDFDHFLNILIFDLWVNCKSQNGILEFSLDHF